MVTQEEDTECLSMQENLTAVGQTASQSHASRYAIQLGHSPSASIGMPCGLQSTVTPYIVIHMRTYSYKPVAWQRLCAYIVVTFLIECRPDSQDDSASCT